jgi:hypothetical protein
MEQENLSCPHVQNRTNDDQRGKRANGAPNIASIMPHWSGVSQIVFGRLVDFLLHGAAAVINLGALTGGTLGRYAIKNLDGAANLSLLPAIGGQPIDTLLPGEMSMGTEKARSLTS